MTKNGLMISLTSLTLLTAGIDNTAIAAGEPPAVYSLQANSLTVDNLKDAMKRFDRIAVKLPQAVEPEKEKLQPATLAEVMKAVVESGGKVSYEPTKNDMGLPLLAALIPIAITVIEKWLEKSDSISNGFPLATKFDVRLCYREQDNKVTKVMLVPRGEDKLGFCS